MTIQIVVGDITTLTVDAIVNAANEQLLGGGGVDGAIHRAAGPELLDACRALPEVLQDVRCPTGHARVTPAFRLPAKFVIHTVGPVWQGGALREPELLASCYRESLHLAVGIGATTIAFPSISTGVYGFPKALAASIATQECARFIAAHPWFRRVSLVAFSVVDAAILRDALPQT